MFIYKSNDTLGWIGDLYGYPVHQSYVGFICEIDHVHNYSDTVTLPTCTEQGYTTHVCSCGGSYVDSYVSALGHNWNDGVITIEPTESSEGVKTFTCTRCGVTKTEAIPVVVSTHFPGDINGDGKVNSKDLTRLLKYLSGENVEVVADALDVNGDGKLNSKDLTRLLKYLSGGDVAIY
ncbi:MAG: dockerin type I repeat-containing protein [Clostridia bacterium]|nr:dockerin type I repeat-containing protein [Clostridia bacterium]